jgi:hypothetical protein
MFLLFLKISSVSREKLEAAPTVSISVNDASQSADVIFALFDMMYGGANSRPLK